MIRDVVYNKGRRAGRDNLQIVRGDSGYSGGGSDSQGSA